MVLWILFLVWWLITFLPPIYINGKWLMKGIAGMTLAPFVFYRKEAYLDSELFRKHERAHILQQRICSPLIFLIIYAFHYLMNRFLRMDHYTAYYNIIFEKLARQAEKE